MVSRPERLPRAAVLRNRRTVQDAFAGAPRRSNAFFSLLTPAMGPAQPQAAFLAPKRLGGAVVRNRLRRRMREIYRRHLRADLQDNHEIWLAKPAATRLSFEDLKEAMLKLRKKT
jgi:ribonuclease P protein component